MLRYGLLLRKMTVQPHFAGRKSLLICSGIFSL
jgi:hypothetical protein